MAKKYEDLDFTDDFMFGKVLYHNPELCQELLELILNKKIRKICFPETQKSISITGDSKGVRFDIYMEDSENIIYDVEMQTTTNENLPKRSRYYHSMLDLNLIEKGMDYKSLKKCYVIFLCKKNIGRLPIYAYRMRCDADPDVELRDDVRTVFVNSYGSSAGISQELKEFLTYIRTGQASGDPESLTRRLQNCVIHARKRKEWRAEYMTLLMRDQEMREEGLKEGHKEINQLIAALISDNRLDDLKRSAADGPFQEQLLREYGIRKYESV